MMTLRHGNRCRVEGNFFLGNHKKGSGGIRVIGEDHVVVNNYIDGVMQGAFWVTSGIPNSPLVGYFQARNCLIAFNTVTRSQGPCIELAAGLGSSGRTLAPEGITVANNLFVLEPGAALLKGTEDRGYRWVGNVMSGDGTTPRPGLRVANVSLAVADGLLRFPASGPRILADGSFPTVTADIDGQPRVTPLDVGCDQQSSAPVLSHALRPAEVGPAWRNWNGLPPSAPTVVEGPGDKPAPLSRQERPQ
jgi:poly(beta-D-mannuronate) lyase